MVRSFGSALKPIIRRHFQKIVLVRFLQSSGLNNYAKVNFHSALQRWTATHANIFRAFFRPDVE